MSKKILLTLPEEFLSAVDDVAQAEHRNRSELVREALREYLISHGKLQADHDESARAGAEILAKARRQSRGQARSGSDLIREWRYRLADK